MPYFKYQYIGLTNQTTDFCVSLAALRNAMPFPLHAKSGLCLFVVLNIYDTSVVTLS
jgi:hypothetical protein